MKLSIIIPIYNVEKYISKCINSCLTQSNATIGLDYELILINDGSTDKSFEIVEKLIRDICGIKLINQINRGLSIARNIGLDNASGEYVWFVDSDDWIAKDAVCKIIGKIQNSLTDVIKIRALRVLIDGTQVNRHGEYNERIITSGISEGIKSMSNTPAQFCIYNKFFLNNHHLRFMNGVFHEDNEFTPRMYWFANTVSFINSPLYFHRQNPTSICHTPNPKRAFDLLKVCKSLSDFNNKFVREHSSEYCSKLHNFISLSLNNAFNIITNQPNHIKKEFNIEIKLKYRSLFKHLLLSKTIKYVIEGIFFYIYDNYTNSYHLFIKFKK